MRANILIILSICFLLAWASIAYSAAVENPASTEPEAVSQSINTKETVKDIQTESSVQDQTKIAEESEKNRFFKDNLEFDPATLPCMSIGAASKGRLINGKPLPYNKNWINRLQSRQYGTPELIKGMTSAIKAFRKQYPKSARLITGDVSYKNGGPMLPHRSHQSGRDIDIGMFAKNNQQMNTFIIMSTSNLDIRKTWFFIEVLLEHASIEYILVDYSIQELLYKYVRFELAASEEYLDRVFQYPRRDKKTGIVRHARGHKNHLHVRFHCPRSMAAGKKYENLLLPKFAELNDPVSLPAQNYISYVPRLKRKTTGYPFSAHNLPDVPGPMIETTYLVSENDTLWSVAKKYKVTTKSLCKLNDLPATARLFPGMPLKVLASESVVQSFMEPKDLVSNAQLLAKYGENQGAYIVKNGDSLWSVAKSQSVKIADLCQWNDLTFKTQLQLGQKLIIQKRKPVYSAPIVALKVNPNIISASTSVHSAASFDKISVVWKGFSWGTLKNFFRLLFS